MSTLAELEKRIQELEEIEAIRRLKYEYWDSLDFKDWERFTNVFTEDAIIDAPDYQPKTQTIHELVAGLVNYLGEHVDTCHQGHQHLIEITSETTAKGVWCLRDDVYNTKTNIEFKGRGYYYEEYRKVNGRWYISKYLLKYNKGDGTPIKRGNKDIATFMGNLM